VAGVGGPCARHLVPRLGTPAAPIGVAYAKDMEQTDRGLLVKGRLDVDDNPIARRAEDGATELIELDLYEVGPTLKGLNPATELHNVKGLTEPTDDYAALRARARDEMYTLLTDDTDREAVSLEDRLEREQGRQQERRLRHEVARFRLEEALGFDKDLIKRLDARKTDYSDSPTASRASSRSR
jgi:hypothetical protein